MSANIPGAERCESQPNLQSHAGANQNLRSSVAQSIASTFKGRIRNGTQKVDIGADAMKQTTIQSRCSLATLETAGDPSSGKIS